MKEIPIETEADATAEGERLLALSDEEVFAEIVTRGEDPQELVARGRGAIAEALFDVDNGLPVGNA